MAQAFSSVDTYLAPFVKKEDLPYREVKQCIQSLVFGLNTPSRWGCVPIDTMVATPNGFKKYNELHIGDLIYTYVDGKISTSNINHIIEKNNDCGKLHAYFGDGYVQQVTPEHRCIIRISDSETRIIRSSELIKLVQGGETVYVPTGVVVNADGTISICDNKFVKIEYADAIDYLDHVWCPSTDDGTAIYKDKNGNIFISGNCQAPFTNFTFDWVVPDDLAELNCIVGGEEVDFKYKDCKREMDMINRAFMEVMIEGDANGRGYQYPIPTYSITKDFDWDTESINNKLLFEMTAKYGIPYFSNYINSDMKPSDIRSMCPLHENTCVCIKDSNTVLNLPIKDIYNTFGETLVRVLTPSGWCNGKPIKMPNTECFNILLENGNSVVLGKNHLQPTKECGTVTANDLKVGMHLPCISEGNKSAFELFEIAEYLNIEYSKITDIRKVNYGGDLYCFEVDNSDHLFVLSNGIITHNCRLRLDLRELRRKNGGYFGSGESTGSVGVVTINMPRLAYKSKSEEEFFENLNKLMDIAARSLHIKRAVVTQYLEQGLYPYTKRYLGTFNNHFSTLAVLGMNEACLNAPWIGDTIASDSGYAFSKRVLDHMRERLSDYQEMYPGELFNLESAPAESTTLRFALHDKKDFPDIITAGDKTDGAPYYTNSSHLPVGYTDDIFTALDHQDDLQTKYTSGTVFHAFLGEKLPNWQSAMNLTRKIAENYKLPYFTFSPTYSICPDHGYIRGEEWTCPECGKKTEVYSRVTGYYRAVQNFNDGKAHEFKDRKEYKVNDFSAADESCEACSTGYTELPEPSIEEDTETAVRKILAPTRKPMLFTTATCPNCKMAKRFISEAGFDCDILLAEENAELVNLYKVSQAPTLIVFNDGEPQTISNVSNIRKYLESINK